MARTCFEPRVEIRLDVNEKKPIRVLHVDDELSFLRVAKECLESQGRFEVDTAVSVLDAAEKMKKKTYDAIISDYQMPEKDGLQSLEELRKSGNSIPFIIFTGKGKEELAIKALNLGADQYLNKLGNPEAVYAELAQGIRCSVERKEAEHRVKESEEKYRRLVENSLQGMLIIQDFRIVFANQALAEISGYSIEELMSLPPDKVKAMIHPDDQKLVWSRFSDRLAGKSVEPRYEYRAIRKDGTVCWLEMFASRVDHNGKPAIQGTIIDITDRKKAEQAPYKNELKPEILVKYNPEAAVYLDHEFKILAANTRFCQLFGYSIEEIKNRKIDETIVPNEMIKEAERLNQDAKNGYASFYTVRKRKNGPLIPVAISAVPVVFEDKLSGYIGSYKDISDAKKAQEEMEESRKHFEMLFNLMADPVAIVDGRGKILEITQKAEEITGFKREELVGKNFLRTKIATTKTKAIMIKNLTKRILGGHIEPYEVEILTKDKRKLLYEINAARIEYKGKPADLVVFRDISIRKKLEEKLRVVGGLTRHDVRNKLCAIRGNIYLLRKTLVGNAEALERLSNMDAAVRQVERILEFAGTYEKLGVEKLAWLDVGKAVDEATSLFSDLKSVKVINQCKGTMLLADSLLRQMFYNLIDNSLKYGEKSQTIRIYCRRLGEDELELIYEDDGIGIPSEIRKHLFTEGAGRGSGYGLFMIKRICEVYGWTITENGKPNRGVRFTVKIPAGKHRKSVWLAK
jgi:PAS domain S-box-containing protein